MNIPEELLKNPHFSRYYRTWQDNPVSIVFIPLAQICREYGLLTEAREICETGLKFHPHSVSGRLMLARIYCDMEKSEEARNIVENVLNEYPGQHEARKLHEQISRSCGPDKNSQLQGSSLWDNVTMARIYADQGEIKTAQKILERIIARNPHDSRALALREKLSR